MLVAIAGAKGSIGATALAYALARHWSSRSPGPVFVEADPDGGAVAARLGLSQEPGMATLAAAGSHDADRAALGRHVQRLPAHPAVLALPSAPGHARAVLRAVGDRVAALGSLEPTSPSGTGAVRLVADVGRLSGESPALPLVLAAARVVIVARPTFEGADAVAVRIAELADIRGHVDLVTIAEGPYRGEDLARAFAVRHLGHLPESGSAMRALWAPGGKRNRCRGPYFRGVRSVADRLECAGPSPCDQLEVDEPATSGPEAAASTQAVST